MTGTAAAYGEEQEEDEEEAGDLAEEKPAFSRLCQLYRETIVLI